MQLTLLSGNPPLPLEVERILPLGKGSSLLSKGVFLSLYTRMPGFPTIPSVKRNHFCPLRSISRSSTLLPCEFMFGKLSHWPEGDFTSSGLVDSKLAIQRFLLPSTARAVMFLVIPSCSGLLDSS